MDVALRDYNEAAVSMGAVLPAHCSSGMTVKHPVPVSILGFENCQSFFSATAHVRCTAPARLTPRGRCRSAYSIFYWQNDTAIVISAYNMRATV